jgi:hypothetical protein
MKRTGGLLAIAWLLGGCTSGSDGSQDAAAAGQGPSDGGQAGDVVIDVSVDSPSPIPDARGGPDADAHPSDASAAHDADSEASVMPDPTATCLSLAGPAADTVFDYLSLRMPTAAGSIASITFQDFERGTNRTTAGYVKHDEKFFARGSCPGGNNPGWGCVGVATEFHSIDTSYVPDGDTITHQTYERHGTTVRYREIYTWDASHTNLYLVIASAGGEPSNTVNPAQCTSEANSQGCDFSYGWGQVWTPNLTGTPQNGTSSSPSIYVGSSDNVQPQGGLSFKLDNDPMMQGTTGFSEQTRGCNQVWFRSSFNANDLESYATGTDTSGSGPHPYTDTVTPGTNPSPLTLDLQSVFILRVYSGCGPHPPLVAGAPPAPNCSDAANACSVFEDHIYGKDSHGLPLGEVGVLIGLTPAAASGGWQVNQGYLAINTYCD